MNIDAETWDPYFSFRGVPPEFYENHKIPNYLRNALPRDHDALLCDIGCGYGQNLKQIRSLGYRNIVGVEPSKMACAYARSQGLEIYGGTLAEVAERFDQKVRFAYMSHVLEHIPRSQIIPTLALIREKVLAPGGSILLAVPNAQSFTSAYWRYEDWTHTTLFTSGSLLYVLRAAGFPNATIFDPDCMMNTRPAYRPFRRILLELYKLRYRFWMRVTSSSTHRFSPDVFSFEVKATAEKSE